MTDKMFFAAQSLLPLQDDFIPFSHRIRNNKWFTYFSEFHKEFKQKLAGSLGVKYVALFTDVTGDIHGVYKNDRYERPLKR